MPWPTGHALSAVHSLQTLFSFMNALPEHHPLLRSLNKQRLWQRTEELARYTLPEAPWTRRAFTDLHLESRVWLSQQMRQAGLQVSTDAAGNLIGRMPGRLPDLPPLVTGSHTDTVVGGGRYDGIIGVLAGIELAHALTDAGVLLNHPFEVIDFLSEEPSDYGISCVGSRAMAGMLGPAMLAAARSDGETLAQGLRRYGGDPKALPAARRVPGSMAAFLELHIEQGPVLEQSGLPIGVVSHIVGIRRLAIGLQGRPDHAGTTPMHLRADALVAAAHLVQQVDQQARALSSNPHYVVATVGRIQVAPNVPNAVPGRVELVLEVRSDSEAVLDTFATGVLSAIEPDMQRLGVQLETVELSRGAATPCSPVAMQAITQAASALGYASTVLPSGAGHDAAYMQRLCPMGMVFIPCLDGRSHCPEESITPDQLFDGTRVLAAAFLELDRLPNTT